MIVEIDLDVELSCQKVLPKYTAACCRELCHPLFRNNFLQHAWCSLTGLFEYRIYNIEDGKEKAL